MKILVLILAIWDFANAQIPQEKKYDPNETVLSSLEASVHMKYGSAYELDYHIMDSVIANSFLNEMTDPYGTLAGCVLFSAWREPQQNRQSLDSVVTGIYKNGQIIWDDYPGTKAGFGGMLLAVRDINNDGRVDILQSEPDFRLMSREGSGVSYLWILSWNGTAGAIINAVDPKTYQSTLVSTDGMFELININRNDINEIRGQIGPVWQKYFPDHNPSTLPFITYGWNGTQYGLWPTVRQVPGNEFLPANLLEVKLKNTVTKNGNEFDYAYRVTNDSTSKQRLQCLYIGGISDTSSQRAPSHWVASSSSYVGGRYFYSSIGEEQFTLEPGQSRGGFGTVSGALPTIVKYYAQGLRTSSPSGSENDYAIDILNNSATGYTIGTKVDSILLGLDSWCDTLVSYVNQCVGLDWLAQKKDLDISDAESNKDSIASNLVRRLHAIKSALQLGDSLSARTLLQKFVDKVEAEHVRSANRMSDECYALLKYNGEYLRDRLPSQ